MHSQDRQGVWSILYHNKETCIGGGLFSSSCMALSHLFQAASKETNASVSQFSLVSCRKYQVQFSAHSLVETQLLTGVSRALAYTL